MPILFTASAVVHGACENDAGKLESSEGRVAIERAGQWLPLTVGDCVPVGARVQVSGGRAVFRLANETLMRASGSTLLQIAEPRQKNWIRLFDGLLHFITRTPHAFDVETDYVNAGVKGTEFIIAANRAQQSGEIIMFEGEVLASNAHGQQTVRDQQAVIARADEAPRPLHIPATRDAVQWTLAYPPLPASPGPLATAIYRGDIATAVALLQAQPASEHDAHFYTQLAAVELQRGETARARDAIDQAIAQQPQHAPALALRALIALTTGARDEATQLLDQAQAIAPNDNTVLVARSYEQQARFDLKGALASAQHAASQNPDDTLVQTRLAELALINGDRVQAQAAAQRALQQQPDFARAHTVSGFIHLQSFEFVAAEKSFQRAIANDSSEALPRLGLGLIEMRRNHVAAGRENIALAVALDPGQSLLRSYLGKAYQEETREPLAADQYALAKTFDASDPTPWYYSALLAQTQNRPLDALDDLQQSITRNDNRAVYRSRLQLDSDAAIRTASQAEIYRELGFDTLAQRSAADAVSIAPSESAGHRQLAEAYADNPQYDAARASEVLQAQLLQPLSATPILPLLGITNVLASKGAGPGELGYREYNAMFVREKPWLSLSGIGGSNQTGAGELTISGVSGRAAYAVNHYHYESDGYRDNNDAQYDVWSAYTKLHFNDVLALTLSVARKEEDRGDIAQQLSLATDSHLNIEDNSTSTLFGVSFTPNSDITLLATVNYQSNELQQFTNASIEGLDVADALDSDETVANIELQGLVQHGENNFIVGVDWAETDRDNAIDTQVTIPPDPPFALPPLRYDDVPRFASGYAYWQRKIGDNLHTILGAGYAEYSTVDLSNDSANWSPKFAATWQPTTQWRVRTAYFQTLKRPAEIDDTLEPSQLGSFTQLFDDKNGTESTQSAFGIDYTNNDNVWLGFEGYARDIELPVTGLEQHADVDQTLVHAYSNWIMRPLAIALSYTLEDSDLASGTAQILTLPKSLKTEHIPLSVKYFMQSGFHIGATATHYKQTSDIRDAVGNSRNEGDEFTTIDAEVGHQFLDSRLNVTLMANNIFDEEFLYQNTELYDNTPRYQPVIPERTLLFRIRYVLD